MDVGVGWTVRIWQEPNGTMELYVTEDGEEHRIIVHVKQPMDKKLTLDRVADELIAIAPWVRLQDSTKEFK